MSSRRFDWTALPAGHVSPSWLPQVLGLGLILTAAVVAVLTLLSQLVTS